jgi:hypothetical protein
MVRVIESPLRLAKAKPYTARAGAVRGIAVWPAVPALIAS